MSKCFLFWQRSSQRDLHTTLKLFGEYWVSCGLPSSVAALISLCAIEDHQQCHPAYDIHDTGVSRNHSLQ